MIQSLNVELITPAKSDGKGALGNGICPRDRSSRYTEQHCPPNLYRSWTLTEPTFKPTSSILIIAITQLKIPEMLSHVQDNRGPPNAERVLVTYPALFTFLKHTEHVIGNRLTCPNTKLAYSLANQRNTLVQSATFTG